MVWRGGGGKGALMQFVFLLVRRWFVLLLCGPHLSFFKSQRKAVLHKYRISWYLHLRFSYISGSFLWNPYICGFYLSTRPWPNDN